MYVGRFDSQRFGDLFGRHGFIRCQHQDLALSLWRAGDATEAETVAEKAASLAAGRGRGYAARRDGLLGNLRYDAAQAKKAEDLKAALDLAQQAKTHYTRGAVRGGETAAGGSVRFLGGEAAGGGGGGGAAFTGGASTGGGSCLGGAAGSLRAGTAGGSAAFLGCSAADEAENLALAA